MADLFAGTPAHENWSLDEAIQRAIISEHAADAVYQDILARKPDPATAAVIREIIKDEQNHQGRLQNILLRLRGGEGSEYEKAFLAGLQQKEVPSEDS